MWRGFDFLCVFLNLQLCSSPCCMRHVAVRWTRWTVRWGFYHVASGMCASWRLRRCSPVVLWDLWRMSQAPGYSRTHSERTNQRCRICVVRRRLTCMKHSRPILPLSHWHLSLPTISLALWDDPPHPPGVIIREWSGRSMWRRRWSLRSPRWRTSEVLAMIGSC